MGTEPLERVAQGALQVLVQGTLRARLVVVRDRLVEDPAIARLLDVGGDSEDQPQRVVVEPGADGVVAALGQRLVLVVGAAGRELGGGDVEDPLPGSRRHHVDEAEEVLVRVAESHPPAEARLEKGGRAGQVERGHALVGVPDVDHPVGVDARRGDLQRRQQRVPVLAEIRERDVDLLGAEVALDQRADPSLVDRGRPWRVELGVGRVLGVAEEENDVAPLPRAELEFDVVRAARRPPVGDRLGRPAPLDHHRPVPTAVRAEEGLALGVEAGERRGAGEVGEVVAALPVFGRVVDDAFVGHHLDLADREVALEVGGVVQGVPETELDRAEQRQLGARGTVVGDRRPPDLEGLAERDDVRRLDLDAGAA